MTQTSQTPLLSILVASFWLFQACAETDFEGSSRGNLTAAKGDKSSSLNADGSKNDSDAGTGYSTGKAGDEEDGGIDGADGGDELFSDGGSSEDGSLTSGGSGSSGDESLLVFDDSLEVSLPDDTVIGFTAVNSTGAAGNVPLKQSLDITTGHWQDLPFPADESRTACQDGIVHVMLYDIKLKDGRVLQYSSTAEYNECSGHSWRNGGAQMPGNWSHVTGAKIVSSSFTPSGGGIFQASMTQPTQFSVEFNHNPYYNLEVQLINK